MTRSTEQRIRRLYQRCIGYDPCGTGGGWSPGEALEILQEGRAPRIHTVIALCQCGCGQTEILHYRSRSSEAAATLAHAEYADRHIEIVAILKGACEEAE